MGRHALAGGVDVVRDETRVDECTYWSAVFDVGQCARRGTALDEIVDWFRTVEHDALNGGNRSGLVPDEFEHDFTLPEIAGRAALRFTALVTWRLYRKLVGATAQRILLFHDRPIYRQHHAPYTPLAARRAGVILGAGV